MEINHKFINSSINGVALHDPIEEDQEDDFIEKVGMGRSYDCVFCRRGFTTAQALGGHMNVHRRDRASNHHNPNPTNAVKPSSSSTRKGSGLLDMLGARGSSGRLVGGDGGGWGMGLGLQGGGGGGEVRRSSQGFGEQGKGEDLDLELRLGHYPCW